MLNSSLEERILDAFPSGNYGIVALLRLLDIVETTEVATAAVECVALPRMLLNPEFVSQHADTPERLLMLVMHELHHVLLLDPLLSRYFALRQAGYRTQPPRFHRRLSARRCRASAKSIVRCIRPLGPAIGTE